MAGEKEEKSMDLIRRIPTIADYLALRPMMRLPKEIVHSHLSKKTPATTAANPSCAGGFEPLLTFTALTYNILAQNHIHRSAYPYCRKETLKWIFRRQLLSTELRAYEADIMCFQEMDRFPDYFEPLLREQLGYDVAYYQRNGAQGDVNAVAWKRNRFEQVAQEQASFEATTMHLGSVPNVAQLVALRAKGHPQATLIVATTHLYWREDCDHIRLLQMHALISSVISFRDKLIREGAARHFGIIVAGDFNSDRDSMAMKAIFRLNFLLDPAYMRAVLDTTHLSTGLLMRMLTDFTVNWPQFHDSHTDYATLIPGSPAHDLPYTTFCLYKGILDFILYSQYPADADICMTPTALRVLPERNILESEGALPNSIYASDHVALVCEFTIFNKN